MVNQKYILRIRAGPESETPQEPFRYIASPLPKFMNDVDKESYKIILQNAILTASEIVKKTGKILELKLSIEQKWMK